MKAKMPVLFVGHGSPMNAIEDNVYSKQWKKAAKKFRRPKAILSVSAHWYTEGTLIQTDENPKMIYDMYGFPEELYKVVYPAKGNSELSKHVISLVSSKVSIDDNWGLDHGTWSVLSRMYPDADIPVIQLSINAFASAEEHYQIGKELAPLRDQGVLIFGSGNVVHNLSEIGRGMENKGYPWAQEFDSTIKKAILEKRYEDVVNYKQYGINAELAVPSPDHYNPLLYVLGALNEEDNIFVFGEGCTMGSLSMTSYLFGNRKW